MKDIIIYGDYKMPQVSIYIPDELYFKLMQHGKRSELIQELLNEYFKTHKGKK